MPERNVIQRAQREKRKGRAPSTQAGEFVREEIRHVREGVHGARSIKQAIAIGLSKARRAGVDLPPPKKGKVSERTRESAARAFALGHGAPYRRPPSAKRKVAILRALKREPKGTASPEALSRQARAAAAKRSAAERSEAAQQAVRHEGAGRASRSRPESGPHERPRRPFRRRAEGRTNAGPARLMRVLHLDRFAAWGKLLNRGEDGVCAHFGRANHEHYKTVGWSRSGGKPFRSRLRGACAGAGNGSWRWGRSTGATGGCDGRRAGPGI